MKNVRRTQWLSKLDMEPLLSGILTTGMAVSVGLMTAGWLINAVLEQPSAGYTLQAISIPQLIRADLRRFGASDFWFRLLIDLGFSTLLITPYARLVVTWLYLVFVKRRLQYAVYAGVMLILLGMVLFSDLVLAPNLRIFPQ